MVNPRCRHCRLERLPEETFDRGLCPTCLAKDQQEGRRGVGAAWQKQKTPARSSATARIPGCCPASEEQGWSLHPLRIACIRRQRLGRLT